MKKIEFEYEYSLIVSNKGNQVLKILLIRDGKEKAYFGQRALQLINKNAILFDGKDIEHIRKLKEFTDELYIKSKK